MRIVRTLAWLVGSLSLWLLSACGGGGGGGSPALAGNWFGTYEDETGSLTTIAVTVNNSLQITSIVIGGTSANVTGTIQPVSGQSRIFFVPLSNGVEAGFFLDDASRHVVFVDDEFNFGVMQKDAGSLPTFGNADLFGRSYSGTGVSLDAPFELAEVFSASVTVNSGGGFSGSTSQGVTFENQVGEELGLNSAQFGRWVGEFQATGTGGASQGPVSVIMTADKSFIGCWTQSGPSFPEDVVFYVWRRN